MNRITCDRPLPYASQLYSHLMKVSRGLNHGQTMRRPVIGLTFFKPLLTHLTRGLEVFYKPILRNYEAILA